MFTFSGIPYHNRMGILKKLDFKDFVNFKQCSKETVEMTKKLRYRLPFNVAALNLYKDNIRTDIHMWKELEYDSYKDEPIGFISEELNVHSTSSDGIPMKDFVRKFVIRTELLNFSDGHPDSLTLIKLIKLKEIGIIDTEMGESDLLQLETTRICITRDHGLKLSAINAFLKQWVENKRVIEDLTIRPIPREEHHLEIFEDLDFSVERTPRNNMGRIQVLHIYSITREDGKKLFVSLDHYDDEPEIVAGEHADLMSFVRSVFGGDQL